MSAESPAAPPESPQVRIFGARTHNLANIDVTLPRNKLVVVTGVSGSGKSSLVFDTLLAEGQRQFIDSLSIYARQYFDQIRRPDVDRIEGLQPTIAIDQHQGAPGPRSTVGTLTEIYDYLRLLYARAGELCCPDCGSEISQQTPEQIQQQIVALPAESRVMILAPLVRGRKGKHADLIDVARKAGFARLRVDGATFPIDELPDITAAKAHDIDAVVDRVVIREGLDSRLAESIRLALKHGAGLLTIVYQTRDDKQSDEWREQAFSTKYACPKCGANLIEVEPRTFSFNSPYGAFETCSGLGRIEGFDEALIVDDSLSVANGAITALKILPPKKRSQLLERILKFASSVNVDDTTPLCDWPDAKRRQLFDGNGKRFAGLLVEFEKLLATSTSDKLRAKLEGLRDDVACADCRGTRLKPEARCALVAGLPIYELTRLAIAESLSKLIAANFAGDKQPIAEPIVAEIVSRLKFLDRAGLGYLSLDRPVASLSGGEHQRVRLATALGSGLVGVLYLLDEPSMGLHPRDTERLIAILRELQQQGNTVVVVEHDEAFMHVADELIDIGPGAGRDGGRVVAQGTPDEVMAVEVDSVTADYLSGRRQILPRPLRRARRKTKQIQLHGATLNNLRNVDFDLPLGLFVAVGGVSGSGKSSLVLDTLSRAIAAKLHGAMKQPGPYKSLQGVSQIERIVRVDQSPIGRSPRSNAATYTGLFDEIRKLFTQTKLAKQRGFKIGRFSFNVPGGRCEECQGQGAQRIEMKFLPDLFVTCPACRGRRFNRQTLAVTFRGKSIADVLAMSVDEALDFFSELSHVRRMLQALADVGLGYLPIGQPSNTLSGGEAQRIKLAAELGKPASGHTLFVLDEPTTGLHTQNVAQLLDVLHQLVDADNTVLVVEHHPSVLASADWLVELGPEGGAGGGRIIAAGVP